MSDETNAGEAVDGLVSRLSVIDQQPLDQRALAFAQLHDELRAALDSSSSAAGSTPR
ncbi:hypothetical protein [Frondihabitans australicus]|uniref:Uncharacterized protein n=1 Tax=Frondihabitans australicus TaxID=386892 RepID=A0A495IH30_9MICO|nr:hypothetical protein [Frondihabitans australicus]RKR74455.1 hypothetical protein C8E83_1569 [Frondihabitans australicus]